MISIRSRRGAERFPDNWRTDEDDLRKIIVFLRLMIAEELVLFGIQDFQKRGGRYVAFVDDQFVDLVNQKDRVDTPALIIPLIIVREGHRRRFDDDRGFSASSRTPPKDV